jgi:hypothetical protein
MASLRPIEANRRNALKSTGPKTEAGKRVSRCSAVRHGLTAETVISALEDAEDYRAFEAATIADYDAHATMETGLFETQADHQSEFRQARRLLPASREVVCPMLGRADSSSYDRELASHGITNATTVPSPGPKTVGPALDTTVELARCFLRLANLPNLALDRLSRYEANLWRQVARVLFALDALDRRKPQERARRCHSGDCPDSTFSALSGSRAFWPDRS